MLVESLQRAACGAFSTTQATRKLHTYTMIPCRVVICICSRRVLPHSSFYVPHALGAILFHRPQLVNNAVLAYAGGCEIPAAVSLAVGSGGNPKKGNKVTDSNLRSKWVSFGDGESLWLEIAIPTVIDSVAIAFRKVMTQVDCWALHAHGRTGRVHSSSGRGFSVCYRL